MKRILTFLIILISTNLLFADGLSNRVILLLGKTEHQMQSFRNIEAPIVFVDSINNEEENITWGFIDGSKIVLFYSYIKNTNEFNQYDYYLRLSGRRFIYNQQEYKFEHVEVIIEEGDGPEIKGFMHESIGEGTASSEIALEIWPLSRLNYYQIVTIQSEHYRDTMF